MPCSTLVLSVRAVTRRNISLPSLAFAIFLAGCHSPSANQHALPVTVCAAVPSAVIDRIHLIVAILNNGAM